MPKYLPIWLLCAVFCTLQAAAQNNLVTNPGFEAYYKCPNDRSEIVYLPLYRDFPTALDWVSPVNTSPDYLNTCGTNDQVKLPDLSLDGYHKPHSGNGCAGISMFTGKVYADTTDYWSEYLETRLSSPLQAGHSYYISFYVCLTYHQRESCNIISVDNIGARLTTEMIDTISPGPMYFISGPPDIHSTPGVFITDTVNWTLISGIYQATGGEQWLTIGRFYTDTINFLLLYSTAPGQNSRTALTDIHSCAYMLVDDVCLIDMSYPVATDTAIYTPQFPIAIGQGKAEGQYLWGNGDTSLQIEIAVPGVYVRQRWSGCAFYMDTFTVTQAAVDYCVWLPTAFSPNGDGKNDMFGPGDIYCHPDFSDYIFNIYNRWGQMVFQSVNPGDKWDGKFGGRPQETGVYFYTLQYMYTGVFGPQNKSQSTPAYIKGDVTLVR